MMGKHGPARCMVIITTYDRGLRNRYNLEIKKMLCYSPCVFELMSVVYYTEMIISHPLLDHKFSDMAGKQGGEVGRR